MTRILIRITKSDLRGTLIGIHDLDLEPERIGVVKLRLENASCSRTRISGRMIRVLKTDLMGG